MSVLPPQTETQPSLAPSRQPAKRGLPASDPARPAVVEGIGVYPLFPGQADTTWVLGCRATDRYLVLPSPVLVPVQRAVLLMDGTRTLVEIQAHMLDEYGLRIDVALLCTHLRNAELLRIPRADSQVHRTDVDQASLHLFTVEVRSLAEWAARHTPHLPLVWFTTCALVASLAVVVGLIAGRPPVATSAPPTTAFVLACLVSIVLHELGHGVAALRAGVLPSSITGALYLGFIPILYLRLPGLYLLTRASRSRVWIAGCATNAVIALAAVTVQHWLPPEGAGAALCAATAQWNLALIALNLFPLLPTDGYFLVSTALNEHNLRRRAWHTLRSWLRGRWLRTTWPVVTYLVASLALLALLGYRMVRWALANGHAATAMDGSLIAVAFVGGSLLWGYVLSRHVSPGWRRAQKTLATWFRRLQVSLARWGRFHAVKPAPEQSAE